MPSRNRVIDREEDKDGRPYQGTPIHLARCWAWSSRKELEYPAHDEEAQRSNVDGAAGFAETEPRRWERFTAEPFVEET